MTEKRRHHPEWLERIAVGQHVSVRSLQAFHFVKESAPALHSLLLLASDSLTVSAAEVVARQCSAEEVERLAALGPEAVKAKAIELRRASKRAPIPARAIDDIVAMLMLGDELAEAVDDGDVALLQELVDRHQALCDALLAIDVIAEACRARRAADVRLLHELAEEK